MISGRLLDQYTVTENIEIKGKVTFQILQALMQFKNYLFMLLISEIYSQNKKNCTVFCFQSIFIILISLAVKLLVLLINVNVCDFISDKFENINF